MQFFDRIDPSALDRREVHLWLLTFTIILVLMGGMAMLMYPTAFSDPVVLTGLTLRKLFFGFCSLSMLVLGYLLDRQLEIRHLRKQLLEEQAAVARIRHEASTDLLSTLPGFSHFQDRLAMEFRRASGTQQPLSLIIVVLKSSRDLLDPVDVSISFGDAAKALIRKLRGEDCIYQFRPGIFCAVLPSVETKNAYLVASRLSEGLQDASGASNRFSFDIQVINFPDHAKSAREMEESVRPFIPMKSTDQSDVEASAVSTESR